MFGSIPRAEYNVIFWQSFIDTHRRPSLEVLACPVFTMRLSCCDSGTRPVGGGGPAALP
jgi:hypothetical protein